RSSVAVASGPPSMNFHCSGLASPATRARSSADSVTVRVSLLTCMALHPSSELSRRHPRAHVFDLLYVRSAPRPAPRLVRFLIAGYLRPVIQGRLIHHSTSRAHIHVVDHHPAELPYAPGAMPDISPHIVIVEVLQGRL